MDKNPILFNKWLELKKPKNTPFIVTRNTDSLLIIKENKYFIKNQINAVCFGVFRFAENLNAIIIKPKKISNCFFEVNNYKFYFTINADLEDIYLTTQVIVVT